MAMTPEQLAATKPTREQFKTEDEFREAVSYWMSRQGRSPMLRRLSSKDSRQPSKSTESTDSSDQAKPPAT